MMSGWSMAAAAAACTPRQAKMLTQNVTRKPPNITALGTGAGPRTSTNRLAKSENDRQVSRATSAGEDREGPDGTAPKQIPAARMTDSTQSPPITRPGTRGGPTESGGASVANAG